ELAAAFAQISEPKNRIDQIVVRAKLQRVDARLAKRLAELLLALFGGRGKALAKAPIVRVDEQLLAGFGVLYDEEAEVGKLHFERIVEPDRDDLVPSCELRERLSPARRADEVGHENNQRAALQHVGRRLQKFLEICRRRLLHAGTG